LNISFSVAVNHQNGNGFPAVPGEVQGGGGVSPRKVTFAFCPHRLCYHNAIVKTGGVIFLGPTPARSH